MQPLAVDVREAARLLAVSVFTIRRMLRDGRLQSVRVGRCVRVSFASIEEFVQLASLRGSARSVERAESYAERRN